MSANKIPLFKDWVPHWLAAITIFAILLTSLFSFALYSSNAASAMGYYGIEPTDVQYSIVLMYAAAVAFLALDFRIIKYITARKYLLAGLIANAATYLVCFYTKNWDLFMICRFLQGVACALLCSIVLHLIFPRLHPSRSRVIGYTIFYFGLQMSIPLCAIYCTLVVDIVDFNWLFYGLNVVMLPVVLLVLVTMNAKARFHKRLPLYQVDWIGYVLYTLLCLDIGFVLVYGQKLNWFGHPLISCGCIAGSLLLVTFVLREMRLKRPLINLRLFTIKHFTIGLLLLATFYILKGTTGILYQYLENVLGVAPLHFIPIWGANILGIGVGMFITSRFILEGKSLLHLILSGFFLLALFYLYMLRTISTTGETTSFIFPLFAYGISTGILFVPLVVFTLSSVPPAMAFNASLLGIFSRFIGFCASISINNYLQLYTKSAVREKVREFVTVINPQLSRTVNGLEKAYAYAGNDALHESAGASAHLNKLLAQQIFARSVRDYFDYMLIACVILIFLLFLLPCMTNVVLSFRRGSTPV
ncbi:MFS transporter [Chitinophaga pendula]|uniref:MFS transporter n=1 Tax=Chitinophaga TaxID=79328 RepID=UPI000BAEFAF1|nr:MULTISPECIES: MFS transporter [Chitinophaga]ASZ12120.1 hypothetical protein CK934_14710 [Chitinophaga sp. MD30]UCJ04841.1 MFS transporter [Chitinophaga pendula]